MTFLLYHLAANPECQNRLRDELRGLFARTQTPTLKDLDACSYLRACARESHRLLPVALGTGRLLENDITLSGYNVPAGVGSEIRGIIPVDQFMFGASKSMEFV